MTSIYIILYWKSDILWHINKALYLLLFLHSFDYLIRHKRLDFKKNKKTFKYVLTSNSKSVIINESSKTTQWTLKIEQQVNSMSPLRTID